MSRTDSNLINGKFSKNLLYVVHRIGYAESNVTDKNKQSIIFLRIFLGFRVFYVICRWFNCSTFICLSPIFKNKFAAVDEMLELDEINWYLSCASFNTKWHWRDEKKRHKLQIISIIKMKWILNRCHWPIDSIAFTLHLTLDYLIWIWFYPLIRCKCTLVTNVLRLFAFEYGFSRPRHR